MHSRRYIVVYILLLLGAIGALIFGAAGGGRDGCRGLDLFLSCATRLGGIDAYGNMVFLFAPLAAVYLNWGVDSREIVAQKILATGKPAWRQYFIIYIIGTPVIVGLWLMLSFYTWEYNQNAGGQLVGLANGNALAFAVFAPAAAFWLTFCMSACLHYITAPFKKK
jgi:hypothetical protein